MTAKKRATRTNWTDPDDAPELTDEFFKRADEYRGETLVRRGRPKAELTKERITIRFSPEVLTSFRATGRGWQTRMDAALMEWVTKHESGKVIVTKVTSTPKKSSSSGRKQSGPSAPVASRSVRTS